VKVVVCLKQVPGTTQVKIDPQTNTLIRRGIENIINPLDAYALEEGVRLKERYGGQVTAISMGPPQAEAALREAISLGADEAILLSDTAFAGDLVLCGRQTLDGDTGQVGPQLAEMLELPFMGYVSQVEEIADGGIRVQRMVEEGYETIEASLPALITVVKEINMPRLPSLRGMTRSKRADIPVWGARELGLNPGQVGLAGSFTQVLKVFSPQRTCQTEIFQGEAESQVECLVGKLKEAGAI
jgi:electron transfer flavoprotein beta subunit